jgi:class 3 adenylate cyclase
MGRGGKALRLQVILNIGSGRNSVADRERTTYLAAILFLDVVGFSKLPNSDQIPLKALFNSVLLEAVGCVPREDFLILDTGDGAVVCFHDPPELALLTAVVAREAWHAKAPVGLRIGLHLGPVQEVRDMNGNRNVIGDGINTAQRILSFADSGEITSSGQYRDAVYHVHGQIEQMFGEATIRADKHKREHHVCTVTTTKEQVLWAERKLQALFPGESPDAEQFGVKASSLVTTNKPRTVASRSGSLLKRTALIAAVASIAAVAAYVLGSRPQPNPIAVTVPQSQEAPARSSVSESLTPMGTPGPRASTDQAAQVGGAMKNREPATTVTAPISPPAAASILPRAREVASGVPPAATTSVEHRIPPRAAPTAREAFTAPPRPQPLSHLSPRCSILLQKMSVGEPLSDSEQKEFRAQCR